MAFSYSLSRRATQNTSVRRSSDICPDCAHIRQLVEKSPEQGLAQSITADNYITRPLASLERSNREGCPGCAVLYQAWLTERERSENVESSVTIKAYYRSLSIGGIRIHNVEGKNAFMVSILD